MMEQTDSGKCHCHIVFVTGFDNIVITDGTTRLCHICHTTSMCKQVAVDLLDTLKAHEEGCVGMAANMIGVKKCIIAVNMGFMNMAMFNPKIVKRFGKYETEEGCLSII